MMSSHSKNKRRRGQDEDDDGNNGHRIYMAASGTKMFMVMQQRCGLVYDAGTGVLAIGTHAPPRMVFGFGVSIPVGDALYVLSYHHLDTDEGGHHSFEAMSGGGGGWAWTTLPAPPPTFTGRQIVVAHAVHPDGCTIFMTTAYRDTPGAPVGTYSYNTREGTWRWHGERAALPFIGQAHFDAELGAWVGLHQDVYICSCQVISPDSVSTTRPPKQHSRWDIDIDPTVYLEHKTTKEKLFPNEGCTMRTSLACMGAGRFCLVECVPSPNVTKTMRSVFGDGDGCVLHTSPYLVSSTTTRESSRPRITGPRAPS